jgi:hypothetical protein
MLYVPIEYPGEPAAHLPGCDLDRVHWRTSWFAADFAVLRFGLLRVSFAGEFIVTFLDEVFLAGEQANGLVANHFAYAVDGFDSSLAKSFREPPKCFRFLTGFTCMEVLAANAPHFEVVLERGQPTGLKNPWTGEIEEG